MKDEHYFNTLIQKERKYIIMLKDNHYGNDERKLY